MEFHRIEVETDKYFQQFWELYESAFSEPERRTRENQMRLLAEDYYHIDAVLKDNSFIGFIAYHIIDGYIFIEQFAILPAYRNYGYGTSIMKRMISLGMPIFLEVELPGEPITDRRIDFYKRLGFVMNDFKHIQCKFRAQDEFLELKIMSYPAKIDEGIKKLIYKKITKYDILSEDT